MVQAPDLSMGHRDLPQALVLLNEMNINTQHVATLVDNMIQKVRSGELSTDQGLSFLEMKYNMLLSYLINLTFIILHKCCGETIEGDPCIDRLIEIRTVLEKIRPIDHKLKYQIDKIVKTAVIGTTSDEPASLKPNPNSLDQSDNDESEEQTRASEGVYVPPKLSAVHYSDETTQQRHKRLQERLKKHSLSSAMLQDLKEEYLDSPVEITQNSAAQQMLTRQQQERQEYEEDYMTRLPISKAEKHKRHQLTTIGTLGDEIVNFQNDKKVRKRKRLIKTKRKSSFNKRKRY